MKLEINGTVRNVDAPPDIPLRWVLRDLVGFPGTKVTTIEALPADGAHLVQRAWIEADVVQCGYCQSGQIMTAVALLEKNAQPSDDDIDAAMSGNICRCGTYQRVREAIHLAARLKRGGK